MSKLIRYKTMPVWNSQTLPESFQKQHNTKPGSWGKLTVLRGSLDFALMTPEGETTETLTFTPQSDTPFVEPQRWHRISGFSDDIECQLSFYCSEEDYFHKKYQLTQTHSEVVDAVGAINGERALDLGCGRGRNALYLNLKGFDVTAWDKNAAAIDELNAIIAQENATNIQTAVKDFNVERFSGNYDVIVSTVVLMFVQPDSIANIIADMQNSTVAGGYNLIVSAMDSDDYPCTQPFAFTFKPGELKRYYQGWNIVKYNENVGELHRTDASGNRIKLRFATLLAQKI
jgi:tellurite methyltransferase